MGVKKLPTGTVVYVPFTVSHTVRSDDEDPCVLLVSTRSGSVIRVDLGDLSHQGMIVQRTAAQAKQEEAMEDSITKQIGLGDRDQFRALFIGPLWHERVEQELLTMVGKRGLERRFQEEWRKLRKVPTRVLKDLLSENVEMATLPASQRPRLGSLHERIQRARRIFELGIKSRGKE